jgi:hypothetical protein
MTTRIIEAFECTCDKCSYTWSSIKLPSTCANKTCRSPRWNREAVTTLIEKTPEIKKNSAASPKIEMNPFTALVEKRLHPDRTDDERKEQINSLKGLLDVPSKKEPVLPTYPTQVDEYGPTLNYD